MLFLENKGIKYLFRSNGRYYQNEILAMKSRDETVQLEINSNRTQNIKDKNIKKQALNMEYYQTRISKQVVWKPVKQFHRLKNIPNVFLLKIT